jgi:hypothetical protein
MELYLISSASLSALAFGRRCRGVVVRGYAVKGAPNTDYEFQKAGASEDEGRHYIGWSCASLPSLI